jgi:hypothetical protein
VHRRTRSGPGLATVTMATALALVVTGGLATQAALAADEGAPGMVQHAGTGEPAVDGSGAAVEFPESSTISASEFTEARADSRAEPDSTVEATLKQDFLEDAAELGGSYYAPSEIEVVTIPEEQVTLVGPTDLAVRSIEIVSDPDGGTVSATADVGSGSIDASAPSPGFASWSIAGSGSYKLTISGWGYGQFFWSKWKLTSGDGDSAKDYWTYKRKAVGDPDSWPNFPDPVVDQLYIRNYPTSATYGVLRNWVDWAGGETQTTCTSSGNTYMEVTAVGVTIGQTFDGCVKNSFARNADVPGEARTLVNQPPLGATGGTIETGYQTTFAVTQGTTPKFEDVQKVVFYQLAQYKSCSSTTASGSCSP